MTAAPVNTMTASTYEITARLSQGIILRYAFPRASLIRRQPRNDSLIRRDYGDPYARDYPQDLRSALTSRLIVICTGGTYISEWSLPRQHSFSEVETTQDGLLRSQSSISWKMCLRIPTVLESSIP